MKHVKTCVPKDSLIMLYRTLVEPYLRYYNTTWGKCGHLLLNKLQALQNRAARVVMGIKYEEADHNLTLKSLGWMNTKQLIDYDTASLMYKITKGTSPEYTQSMFEKCDATHSYNTRSAQNGNVITTKRNSAKGQTAFVYSGAHVWNIRM